MHSDWTTVLFGGGSWTAWYLLLLAATVMLLAVAAYAWQDSTGPSATPMLMLMVFCLAFLAMTLVSTVDVVRWAGAAGYGWGFIILSVLLTWAALGQLWTFLFWATDPNYPGWLLPGRLLFTLHAMALCAGNLWLLSSLRARRVTS